MNSNHIEIVEMGRYLSGGENFFLEYNEAEVFVSPHLHRYIEIELITGGSGYEEVDGRIYEVGPGDITIMLPDEVHSFVSRNNEPLKITSVKVSPYYLPENAACFGSSRLLKNLPEDEYTLICQLCGKLYAILQRKDRNNLADLAKECIRMIFLLCQTHLGERRTDMNRLRDYSAQPKFRCFCNAPEFFVLFPQFRKTIQRPDIRIVVDFLQYRRIVVCRDMIRVP